MPTTLAIPSGGGNCVRLCSLLLSMLASMGSMASLPTYLVGWDNQELAADPSMNLVGHWEFDDGSGTTAFDSSGNDNNGTLVNGPTWTTGQVNGSLRFDGVDDYVRVANLAGGTSTVTLWLNTSAGGLGTSFWNGLAFFGYEQGGGVNDYGCALNGGGKVVCQYGDSGPTGNKIVNDGLWHFIAYTRDASTGIMKIYVDGLLDTTGAAETGFKSPLGTAVGTVPNTRGQDFDGTLDDVRIYSGVLSDTEILSLYTNATGNVTSLEGSRTFDASAHRGPEFSTSFSRGEPDLSDGARDRILFSGPFCWNRTALCARGRHPLPLPGKREWYFQAGECLCEILLSSIPTIPTTRNECIGSLEKVCRGVAPACPGHSAHSIQRYQGGMGVAAWLAAR